MCCLCVLNLSLVQNVNPSVNHWFIEYQLYFRCGWMFLVQSSQSWCWNSISISLQTDNLSVVNFKQFLHVVQKQGYHFALWTWICMAPKIYKQAYKFLMARTRTVRITEYWHMNWWLVWAIPNYRQAQIQGMPTLIWNLPWNFDTWKYIWNWPFMLMG
jgi:hypothetical protein